jgi:hypothetical protein
MFPDFSAPSSSPASSQAKQRHHDQQTSSSFNEEREDQGDDASLVAGVGGESFKPLLYSNNVNAGKKGVGEGAGVGGNKKKDSRSLIRSSSSSRGNFDEGRGGGGSGGGQSRRRRSRRRKLSSSSPTKRKGSSSSSSFSSILSANYGPGSASTCFKRWRYSECRVEQVDEGFFFYELTCFFVAVCFQFRISFSS